MPKGFGEEGRPGGDSGPSGPIGGSRRLYDGTQTRRKTNLIPFFRPFQTPALSLRATRAASAVWGVGEQVWRTIDDDGRQN